MIDLKLRRGRRRLGVGALWIVLALAAPALVFVVAEPTAAAKAKKKGKKGKKDAAAGPAKKKSDKDKIDLGEKRDTGLPEIIKEKERIKTKLEGGPTLKLSDFKRSKELQKAEKIEEQLKYLQKIIDLQPQANEMPGLLFQKGELLVEKSEFYFMEGMGLDDEIVQARDKKQTSKQKELEAKKKKRLDESKYWKETGVAVYEEIIKKYKKFDRLGDVLYSVGQAYWDRGEHDAAIPYYRQLITQFPKSQFVPDAYLAFGEHYFSKKDINRALEAYQRTASYEDSKVFAYAVYKQGWCYYNQGKFEEAGDKFKEVILYSELNPQMLGERKITLGREARKDFVLTYSHYGDPRRAAEIFKELAPDEKEQYQMLLRLADIFYGEGKDREAIVLYRVLMNARPDETRNPFFQARIVTCARRLNEKRFVVKMARALVDEFKKLRKFAAEHGNDPNIDKAKLENDVQDAEDLSDNTLRSLATTWHQEARKTKDPETYELAYELYGDYLELFSDKPPAYEIRFFYAELLYYLERFERAGEEYTKVLLQNPGKGKYSEWSAEEAVRAFDDAVTDFDRKNKRPPLKGEAALKPLPIPNIKKNLLAAATNYLKYYPEGKISIECKYKIAKLLYDYNNFDQAAERFVEITTKHPDSGRAEMSANLTLDIYNLRQEWKKLNAAARTFVKNPNLIKNEGFKKTLYEILETSSFKLIADHEVAGDWDAAAKAYLTFVDEFPKSELADKAMVNAAINLLKAGKPKESIAVRLKFVNAYPASPLVPDSMYAVAESYEQVVDFKDAADWLEKFVEKYPKDSRSKDAQFNASIYREGLGQYKAALKSREAYLKAYPKSDDVAQIFLSQARLYTELKDPKKASEIYIQWGKKYAKSKDEEFDAKFKAVEVLRNAKRNKDADNLEYSIVNEYKRMGKTNWAKFKNETDAQARIRFSLADEEFEKYKKLKVEYPRKLTKASTIAYQRSIKKKTEGKDKIKAIYTDVVKLGRAEWAIASLYRVGEAHLLLVDAIAKTPVKGFGLDATQTEMFRDKLSEMTLPIEDQAAEAFKLCVDKSIELAMFNQWTQKCLNFMEEKRPDVYPQIVEDFAAVELPVPFPPSNGVLLAPKVSEIKQVVLPGKKPKDEEPKAGTGKPDAAKPEAKPEEKPEEDKPAEDSAPPDESGEDVPAEPGEGE